MERPLVLLAALATLGANQPRRLVTSAIHLRRHSAEPEAADNTRAGLFPLRERLFGTSYLPEDRQPSRIGVGEAPPAAFLLPFLHTFRPLPPTPAATLETA